MSKTTWSKKVDAKVRRTGALHRLNLQLKTGSKSVKGGEYVPLTEKDVNRINKEIEILKARV